MSFLARHNFQNADFDGCMYGLRAVGGRKNGMLINKPWRIACSPNSSLPRFLNLKCDRSHEHAVCAGSYTKGTQSYTPSIVKQVHRSLNYDAECSGEGSGDSACSLLEVCVPTSQFDTDPSCSCVSAQGDADEGAIACPAIVDMGGSHQQHGKGGKGGRNPQAAPGSDEMRRATGRQRPPASGSGRRNPDSGHRDSGSGRRDSGGDHQSDRSRSRRQRLPTGEDGSRPGPGTRCLLLTTHYSLKAATSDGRRRK